MSPLLQQPLRVSLCVASGFFGFALVHTFFICTGFLMAPPQDTAGSAGTHQPQQPAAPGRSNQKSTTLRNGTADKGWFYPTPAALKAAADVRGARAAREFFRL